MMEDQIKFWVLDINKSEEYSGENKHSFRNYLMHFAKEILYTDNNNKLILKDTIDLESDRVSFKKTPDDIEKDINNSSIEYKTRDEYIKGVKFFTRDLQRGEYQASLNQTYSQLKTKLRF